MEKRKPHYNLAEIKQQMNSVENMNLTSSSKLGIRTAGMTRNEALGVVINLSITNFYKSMTTHENNKVWQDVYHAKWRDRLLYVKFQQDGAYFVISFKEL